MKIPKQAKPVIRTISTARIEDGISQSGLCDLCNIIPNPALKAACLVACGLVK